MRISAASLLAALLSLCSCALGPGDPAVELGTGEIEFLPLADGDTTEIIQGPQGGFHLLASIHTRGIEAGDRSDLSSPDNPTITFDVVHEGESVITIGPITQGLDPAPIGDLPFTHQMTGRFAILDIEADDELEGETVTFSVRVDDARGESISDQVEVDLVAHPDNL